MADPYAPNCDEMVVCEVAGNVAFGDSEEGELVLGLTGRGSNGVSLAAFLNREQALEVFGRFHQQLREMGWLQ